MLRWAADVQWQPVLQPLHSRLRHGDEAQLQPGAKQTVATQSVWQQAHALPLQWSLKDAMHLYTLFTSVRPPWQLSGSVGEDLSDLGCSLMFLELQNNQLSGGFPPIWAPLLQLINLANNRVTGP